MRGMTSERRKRNGFAVLELAVWSVVLLPVTLLGFSYGTFFHNDSAIRRIPAAVLRETVGGASQWASDGDAGRMIADLGRLREIIRDAARRAARESVDMTYALHESSSTACFWVLNVDPHTGLAVSDEARECVQLGPLSLQTRLEARQREIRGGGVGVPLGISGVAERYASQVVLVGVEVGGLFHGVAEWREGLPIQHGCVKRLRDEVEL